MVLPISEKEFQSQVITYAKLRQWKVASFRKVRVQRNDGSTYWETPVAADGAGWPDLVLTRGKRKLAVELKVPPNKPTAEQVEWLASLRATGDETYIWYPKDWGTIDATLF